MRGFRLLFGKEMRESARTARLPVVLLVFALLGLVSPVLARYMREILEAVGGNQFQGLIPDPVVDDAVIQFTKNLGQFGVLIAVLISMGSVAGEKERGTAAFLLTKPLDRGAFLGAKVAAIGLLLAMATALAGASCWAYTAILFEPLPVVGYVIAVALVWLSLAVFAAITFAASVVAPSALVAGGVGIVALLLAGFASVVPGLAPYLPTGLWGIATELAVGNTPVAMAGPIVANVSIIVIACALSAWSFRRQEL
jgi:ABC-2 type transport system permease protein